MAHIWQGVFWQRLRSGKWLTSARARGYSLIPIASAFPAVFVNARHGFKCGFRDYEISLLAAAWTVPLISPALTGATEVPSGLLVMIMLCGVTLHRGVADREGAATATPRIAQA